MAQQVWQALVAQTPVPLFERSRQTSPGLPFLPGALQRYLAELPDRHTGLSFTEAAILDILKDGPLAWSQVFARFMQQVDPLPWHGDLMFLGTMARLRDAGEPALTSVPANTADVEWGKATFALTSTGQAVRTGHRDWRDCAPRERSLGGTRCFSDPDWRWDSQQQCPSPSARAGRKSSPRRIRKSWRWPRLSSPAPDSQPAWVQPSGAGSNARSGSLASPCTV